MTAESKYIVQLTKDGQEALRLAGRLESAHPSLGLASMLMRCFTSVVRVSILAVNDGWHYFSPRRCVTGMTLTANRNHHLIHEPRVAERSAASPKLVRVIGAEFRTPQPNRFIGNGDSAFGQQILDVTQAQLESMVVPNGTTDDLWRKAVATIFVCHAAIVPERALI